MHQLYREMQPPSSFTLKSWSADGPDAIPMTSLKKTEIAFFWVSYHFGFKFSRDGVI